MLKAGWLKGEYVHAVYDFFDFQKHTVNATILQKMAIKRLLLIGLKNDRRN